ncbi:hypothetical protein GOBAR_AA21825 [Gossypium barbadense]|uniref:Uncharacterized protein n=1 Tax=Gossypium barbadense TaxID=3634 RepID=A0A2P5X672_GOSBA|nr:hypothetical protein GOBAR_AA21825 [Gossypium barbadense]
MNTGVGKANEHAHGHAIRQCELHGRVEGPVHTMTNTRGKKTSVPASKKRKGASSSSGPTTKIRHPFLQFPPGN